MRVVSDDSDHDAPTPASGDQVVLGHDPIAIADQQLQEVDDLWLQRTGLWSRRHSRWPFRNNYQ